jgi:hypothetical protein
MSCRRGAGEVVLVKMSLRAKKQARYSRSVLNGVGELRKPTLVDAGRTQESAQSKCDG